MGAPGASGTGSGVDGGGVAGGAFDVAPTLPAAGSGAIGGGPPAFTRGRCTGLGATPRVSSPKSCSSPMHARSRCKTMHSAETGTSGDLTIAASLSKVRQIWQRPPPITTHLWPQSSQSGASGGIYLKNLNANQKTAYESLTPGRSNIYVYI